MSTTARSDLRHGADHDQGLDHPHDWAREPGALRAHGRRHGPVAADPAAFPAPSSTRHDDALYA